MRKQAARRSLGFTPTEHVDLLTERLESAERFFGEAVKRAKAGNCQSAITNLVLGAGYEGEAQAHAEGTTHSRHMTRVRKLFGVRDKAAAQVITACLRPKS